MTAIRFTSHIDPSLSVNEVLARWPASARLFNTLGVDTCCGGGLSLRDAATGASVDLGDMLAMLDTVTGTAGEPASPAPR